jgi:hypothetical protein
MEVVSARHGIAIHQRSGKRRGGDIWSTNAVNCAAGLGDGQNQKKVYCSATFYQKDHLNNQLKIPCPKRSYII